MLLDPLTRHVVLQVSWLLHDVGGDGGDKGPALHVVPPGEAAADVLVLLDAAVAEGLDNLKIKSRSLQIVAHINRIPIPNSS